MKNWFNRHLQVLFFTLGQFYEQGLSLLMTVLALGIGLSIPLTLYTAVDGVASLGNDWQERPQISLYLQKSISEAQINNIQTALASETALGEIRFISAKEGLAELSTHFDLEPAIALLDTNPLPDVFVVYPIKPDSKSIAELSKKLGQINGIEKAQYDFKWLQKLAAITQFLKRAVIVLAGIISMGILLLIANTIRLEISTRKDEIEISDQLGATSAFIERPFLYLGALEGLFGGMMAVLISAVIIKLLSGPLNRLSDLYGLELGLSIAQPKIILWVLFISTLLGWLSAKFTLRQHLISLKPL